MYQRSKFEAALHKSAGSEQHNTCVQVLDGLRTMAYDWNFSISILPVTPWSQSVSNRWFGIVCYLFFDTLTDKLYLIWTCHFYFSSWIFLQVAAPSANAALLGGLVANLSTETVPVRGSRDRRVFNVHKGLPCSAHRDFINWNHLKCILRLNKAGKLRRSWCTNKNYSQYGLVLEEISTIVKTCDNLSAVKCLCLCLYWGAEYWTCCITQCQIDWIFTLQGRSMQSSQIDWKASPSKLVVPWCFIAGFLPSSFAYIGDVPMEPGRKPGLWTNCRFHLTSRAFPRWMHHAFPRECPYPHEVWTLCSSEI